MEKSRASQGLPQGLRKLRVRDRFGCGEIHRTPEVIRYDRMINGRQRIVNCDPAPVLLPAPHPPAKAEPERREHFTERPPFRGEHHTEPHINDSNSRILVRPQGAFPSYTDRKSV